MTTDDTSNVDRRTVLKGLSATAATTGLAGCGSGSGGDDGGDGGGGSDGGDGGGGDGDGSGGGSGDLGERVPTMNLLWISGVPGYSDVIQGTIPIIEENLSALGVEMETQPGDVANVINATIEDQRVAEFTYWFHTLRPERLDPELMVRRYAIDWAGGNGNSNPPNYTSCDYSYRAFNQSTFTDPEKRKAEIMRAYSIMHEDRAVMPTLPASVFAVARDDLIEINQMGQGGLDTTNAMPYIYSTAKGSLDEIRASAPAQMVESTNFPILSHGQTLAVWGHLLHTTINEYNHEYELVNGLAKNIEFEDQTTVNVELVDGAVFHNGDPITSEHVKFTFDYFDATPGAFPTALDLPLESIEEIDEMTTRFNLEKPQGPMVTREFPLWGIMHKPTWEAGLDDPEGFQLDPEDFVGSGPFELDAFQQGEFMRLTPFEDHAVHDAQSPVVFQLYRSQQTATQAFQEGELNIITGVSPSLFDRLMSNMDTAVDGTRDGYASYMIYPDHSHPPMQFRDFRAAVSGALDRQRMNEVAFYDAGFPIMHSTALPESHPFVDVSDLEPVADSPAGNVDAMRELLSDAGWGWDDQGLLHFPPDADLTPPWPKGEVPDPGDFPCLSDDGTFDDSYEP